jgi:hypothetical protein
VEENVNGEVYRGHIEECLRHLAKMFHSKVSKGSKKAAEAKKPMADFCGITIDTVNRWFNDPNLLPVGETLIKLISYLDMMGYRVIELERMPKSNRNLLELIGYGILTSEEAAKIVGYASKSTLFQVLQGNYGVSEEKSEKIWNLWKERREELGKKKEESKKLFSIEISIKTEADVSEKTQPQEESIFPRAVVEISEGLLTLLGRDSLRNFSEKEKASLKSSTDLFLSLSIRLSILSSKLVDTKKE